MQQFQAKAFKFCLLICFVFISFSKIARAEELFLEPVIQGYAVDEIIPVRQEQSIYFINIGQLATILQFKLISGKEIQGEFLSQNFNINPKTLTNEDYRIINGEYYFSIPVYEHIFPVKMKVDIFDMQLKISSEKDLPLTQRILSEKRTQNFVPLPEFDSFKNYQFDNRMWSAPVADFTYRNNFAVNDYNGDNKKTLDSNYYQIDMAMLAAGFDTYASFFADSETNDYAPRARITFGRTFLDEPKNALNLTTFEAGDVTGFNSTLFNNSASGRGVYASSFKDLVLSADKTIDINGPLSQGWNVELYLNDQLIGFRQSGINGRYQFSNIPVNYGLNAFKLVFYGPYGEIQTEERNYYSGTSPVKSGEFGYNINAYQKDRYLLEKNEPFINPSDKTTFDFTGYYGLNDEMTMIAGLTQTPNVVDDATMNLATAGMQFIFQGASFQYNSLYDLDNQILGHHFDIQGDVYIGNIFARYDYYGDLQAPIAFYNDEYLKDIAELRLTGFLPLANLPYYLSYLEYNNYSDEKTQEIHTRFSPSFMTHYNFTVENIWTKNQYELNDDIIILLQAQYDRLGLHSQVRYRVSPDAYMQSFGHQIDYRWNKNTYFQANWDHDYRSQYSTQSDLDTFSISAGRLFDFGGLTLGLSANSDDDATISLTYNMSFGKVPNKAKIFTNAQTQMSERSSVYAKVIDEKNQPIAKTQLIVSGLQDPVITDENGEALITDIAPYQKTILRVDTNSVEDISLIPEFESKKLVLRPGTVLPLTIPFSHKGAFEGAIAGPQLLSDYKVVLKTIQGETISSQTPEIDGSFIFDGVKFGKYKLIILSPENKEIKSEDLTIDKDYYSISPAINI